MAIEILAVIDRISWNGGADRAPCGTALLALEFIAESRDNAAALFMRPMRPEPIDSHLI